MSIVHVAFYPSDWLAGTRGLSDSETGVYITLICRMYEMAAPLERDDDRLSRLCGCKSKAAFKKILNYLIDEGKILDLGNEIFNERVQKEIKKSTEKSRKAKEAAESRWNRKPNKNNGRTYANASLEHMPQLCQSEPEPEKNTTATSARENLSSKNWLDRLVKIGGNVIELHKDPKWILGWKQRSDHWMKNWDLELDCVPVVQAICQRAQTGKIKSWMYFEQAIADHHENRLRKTPEGKPNEPTSIDFRKPNQRPSLIDEVRSEMERLNAGGG